MGIESTMGHDDPLQEFIDRAATFPCCPKCGSAVLGMREALIEIDRLRAELAHKNAWVSKLQGVIDAILADERVKQ